MGNEIERTSGPGIPSANVLNLGPNNTSINLTGISPEKIEELRAQHASGMIELQKKDLNLKIDNASLATTLDSFNNEAAKATQSNISMTATHTQSTAIGRTEVVIGNTDRAASGKLSTSAIGAPDRILWIVGICAVAAVIVALIAFRH